MKPLNILFLTAWYPNELAPLNGNFIQKHAEAVAEFCNVSVLLVCPKKGLKKHSLKVSKNKNLSEYLLYYPKINSKIPVVTAFLKLFFSIFYTFKGIKIIRKSLKKINIIHVNILTRLGVVALFYKIFRQIPYIITEHWTGYLSTRKEFKGDLKILFTKIAVRYASAVTVVSQNLKKAMEAQGLKNKNYKIVYNVIDTNIFNYKGIKKSGKIKEIIHITNFKDEHKNISGILRTVKQLSETRQDFKLNIVGIGENKITAAAFAHTLGIEKKFVSFLGRVETQQLASLIQNAQFLLMFSNYETFQIPVIESLACGVPVLTTKCGGILDHTGTEFGRVIEPKNEQQLIETINYMLDNASDFKPEKLRQYAENNYGKKKVALQFLNLYKDA